MRGPALACLVVCAACGDAPKASPAPVTAATTVCPFMGVDADGAIVLDLAGTPTRVLPFGVDLPSPVPATYLTLVSRLRSIRSPMRCTIRDATATPIRVRIDYFAWQDKSGDVWQDLAITLLEEGMVQVATTSFPERVEYLRHQRP